MSNPLVDIDLILRNWNLLCGAIYSPLFDCGEGFVHAENGTIKVSMSMANVDAFDLQ